eukprot:jgi/Psemu1/7864/gm1.7864_g
MLNSSKRRFEEAGAAVAWIEALDYVHYKLFPDHDKGNTYATNHIWGLGIILCYLLCGYPPLNGKADIQCYDTIGIGPKANLKEQRKMEMDGRSFPAKTWYQLTQPRKKWKLKQLANKEKREEEDGNERNIVHWLHLYTKCWKSLEDLEEYNNYPVPHGTWGCKVVYETSDPRIQKWNPDRYLPAPPFKQGLQIKMKQPLFPISEDKVVIFPTKVSDHSNFRLNGIAVKQI